MLRKRVSHTPLDKGKLKDETLGTKCETATLLSISFMGTSCGIGLQTHHTEDANGWPISCPKYDVLDLFSATGGSPRSITPNEKIFSLPRRYAFQKVVLGPFDSYIQFYHLPVE